MIALGSDHGGYELKLKVIEHLTNRGMEYRDYGCFSKASCDYPEFGRAAAQAVADGACDRGIIICTTGLGISMTANRIPGIRCAACDNQYLAKMTRDHNDANVLSLGAAVVGERLAIAIVDTFLDTPFSNEEKHLRRIKAIEM